jgi:KipI family sensor histidine kinase inhibitor
MRWKHAYLGESCLCWTFGMRIDVDSSRAVLSAYRALRRDRTARRLGILDTVPAYSSIAVYFDPSTADVSGIIKRVRKVLSEASSDVGRRPPRICRGRRFVFPVRYDGEDLGHVASVTGLTERAVVDLHTGARYTVAMIGFLPHFPYLVGLDRRLATPRRDSPRARVPAGAVAIGGAQAGIYPRDSPGGWNLIGSTDPRRLARLRPGDTIVFREI